MSEPITIFGPRVDPAGVLQLVRSRFDNVEVDGTDEAWTQLTVTFPKRRFWQKAQTLVLSHDPDYYAGPGWPTQVTGMGNFVGSFATSPPLGAARDVIARLRFALAVRSDVDMQADRNDPKLELLFAICDHLDGFFFSPSTLRDAHGRVIVDAAGDWNPNAVLPKVDGLTPVVPEPAPDAASRGIDQEPSEDEPSHEDEDEWEPQPPSAEQVARRALVLAAVSARALVEMGGEPEQVETFRQTLLDWVETLELGPELEQWERDVLDTPAGGFDAQTHVNAMWRVEGLTVLAWALHRYDMPHYDQLTDPQDLHARVGLMDVDAARDFLATATLRPPAALDYLRTHYLMVHWRLRDYMLRPAPVDFVEMSKGCWFGTFELTNFTIVDNDMALGELPITACDPDVIGTANSIAMERHLACNWLNDARDLYSNTDTST